MLSDARARAGKGIHLAGQGLSRWDLACQLAEDRALAIPIPLLQDNAQNAFIDTLLRRLKAKDVFLDRGRQHQELDDLCNPRTRNAASFRGTNVILHFPGPNAFLQPVRESQHIAQAMWARRLVGHTDGRSYAAFRRRGQHEFDCHCDRG